MKYVVMVNSHKCLFTAEQLEQFIEVLAASEIYEDTYIGANKGTCGSNNSYVPVIKPNAADEWFTAKIMRDDFVETIKLRMKLDEPAKPWAI